MKRSIAVVLSSLTLAACAPKILDLASDGGSGGSGTRTDGSTPASMAHVQAQKIDLLFMIDNSASMGDKQVYLQAAIPELIDRLVRPSCLDASGNPQGPSTVNGTTDGVCPSGQTVEFPPVHDMHLGIVSSSLGPRLGDQTSAGASGGACLSTATVMIGGQSVPANNDDQAHLLDRTGNTPTTGNPVTGTSTDAPAPDDFLAWFPTVSENAGKAGPAGVPAVTSETQLDSDFSDLVGGVQSFGCGIESQLESWYRFLIQPDPYASLSLDQNMHAQWVGVDTAILQQRHDFLRPDSLVVIIDLTDENDSEIDVRAVGGQGYLFMSTAFDPPRGTSACDSNPGASDCTTCAHGVAYPDGGVDPCTGDPYQDKYDWGYDLNLRHVHMKAKYGLDPQFPINRYLNGLTSATVPDRNGEYPPGVEGDGGSYAGVNDCTNPLFAASLPDPASDFAPDGSNVTTIDPTTLCKLTPGGRPASNVFYAVIGGVPHQLLHYDPNSAANSQLTQADWVKILGNDPENYDYTGIDPHMVESQTPRNGTPLDPSNVLAPPTAANTADPINGREWITNEGAHADLNVDLEYACIFPLAMPRDCTNADNSLACDCSTMPGVLDGGEVSPVCDPVTVTQQDYAKAYPTVRELLLAKKLGTQGIASSICPTDIVDNASGTDALYGYRPAVDMIVRQVKSSLLP